MTDKKEVPVYEQIVTQMKENIRLGIWEKGQKLPGERELCAMYRVSRGTVKAALLTLQRQGLVKTLQGSGTYVEKTGGQNLELEQFAQELVVGLAGQQMGPVEILKLAEQMILAEKWHK